MSRKAPSPLQEEHLDFMIAMAFRQADLLEAEIVCEQCAQPFDPETQAAADAVLTPLFPRIQALERRHLRRTRLRGLRRRAPRLVEIAACLILALGVATPIAIANVEPLRVRIMKFLIELRDGHADLSLRDAGVTLQVPAEWQGDYYPAYIPEGFSVASFDTAVCMVTYRNDEDAKIMFAEFDEDSATSVDTENAKLDYVTIHGDTALVIDHGDHVAITWNNGQRYFLLLSDASREETLHMAESVLRIN